MQYIFILGRNPTLSVAELHAFFAREGIEVRSEHRDNNALLADLSTTIEGGALSRLGGTIAIAKVLASGAALLRDLDKQDIYYGTKNNMTYCLWHYTDATMLERVSAYLKKRFKNERLRASEKKLTGRLALQDGGSVAIASGLIDEEYVLFGNCFGKVIEKARYDELESRDMNKPERREALAISPRLAKIMITLSGVRENETLADVFCGVGTILTEALLQHVKVIGVDKDEHAIASAKKNLSWMHFPKKEYTLFHADSRKVVLPKVNVLVSEPDLGELLKKNISESKAKVILQTFETLMIHVLNNAKRSVARTFVFSAPFLQLNTKKRKGCSLERILEKTGLRLVQGPFHEFRKNQIVGREIFVLEKVKKKTNSQDKLFKPTFL